MITTTPTDGSRSWLRLDGIDALRGLAIFFVLMNHVNIADDCEKFFDKPVRTNTAKYSAHKLNY